MMRLEDLPRINELQGALGVIDTLGRKIGPEVPIVLNIGNDADLISAEEASAFLEWRRQQIFAELKKLGVAAGPPSPVEIHNETARQREDSSPAHEAAPSPPRHLVVQNQPGGMSREAALAEAKRRLRDFDPFQHPNVSQADAIAALANELTLPAEPAAGSVCSECDEPATATIAGLPYCRAHQEAAPRPSWPSFIRKVIG